MKLGRRPLIVGLLGLVPAAVAAADEQQSDFERRLLEAARIHRDDEFFLVTKEGPWVFRRMHLWARISAERRITVFLDDSSGGRIRTLPDEVDFRFLIDRIMALRAVDGEVTIPLPTGLGQGDTLRVEAQPGQEVVEIPVLNRYTGLVPTAPIGLTLSPEACRRYASELLSVRTPNPQGRSRSVNAIWTMRAAMLLHAAGDLDRAIAELRAAVLHFESPLCAWAEYQFCRLRGDQEGANTAAELLTRRWPESIPAQFVVERPGEYWVTPYNAAFVSLSSRETP